MSSDEHILDRLSPQAFADFKEIYSREFPDDLISDDELHKRGLDVLKLFALLSKPLPNDEPKPAFIQVTDIEARALEYLHRAIYHDKQSPSVRDIAEVVPA
jgi:hypothetical protein